MNRSLLVSSVASVFMAAISAAVFSAQEGTASGTSQNVSARPAQQGPATPGDRPFDGGPGMFGPGGPPPFGPGGAGGTGGPGGPGEPGGPPGGPMGQKRELLKQFDKDGNGLLNKEERQAARESIKKDRESMQGRRRFGFRGGPGGPGGFGPTTRPAGGPTTRPGGPGMGMQRGGMFGPPPGFGGPGGNREPGKPGPKVSPEQVKSYPDVPFYEPTVLRTVFLEFEDADWEAEMVDFYHTDVAVPATLMVDGKKYPNVGVNFRGNTSFMMAGTGSKRSLKLSLDYADSKQQLGGYKSIELLNSAEDPTFLHTILYLEIARHYIAAPKANLVKVVINGESWGVYINTQPFDKQFVKESFAGKKGDRWKVPVNFRGDSGLAYLGDDIEQYKSRYEMKNEGGEKAWKALVTLCRTLKETPTEQLEEALKPMLDIDGALWYLAIDNTLINNDGFWTRGSDYGLYRDAKGKFHILPYDVNETFKPMGGPGGPGGFGRGPRASGVMLDPLTGADQPNKAMLNRLLAVPRLREQYLRHVRTIANDWLDWNKLQPVVERYRSLMEKEVEADTRKLYSFTAFKNGIGMGTEEPTAGERQRELSLKAFAEQRRSYLLNHPEIKKLTP